MWPFSKEKKSGSQVVFSIEGLHCSSCVLNIDGTLEDLEGVHSSQTSYAKAKTEVRFDPEKVTATQLRQTIESLGYTAKAGDSK